MMKRGRYQPTGSNWSGMEAGAFAAFSEVRDAAIARMRAAESDPLIDNLASGGKPHIVDGVA